MNSSKNDTEMGSLERWWSGLAGRVKITGIGTVIPEFVHQGEEFRVLATVKSKVIARAFFKIKRLPVCEHCNAETVLLVGSGFVLHALD